MRQAINPMPALLLLIGGLNCVPQGRYVPLGVGDLISSEDLRVCEAIAEECGKLTEKCETLKGKCQDIERINEALSLQNSELQERNTALERQAGAMIAEGLYAPERARGYERALEKYGQMAKLYLQSLGMDVSSVERLPANIVTETIDLLTLNAFIGQSRQVTPKPEKAKQAIKENFIEVKSSKGGFCTGLLLTGSGIFVTANHCAPLEYIIHNRERYSVRGLSFNKDQDILLGQTYFTLHGDVGPLPIILAPAAKIRRGAKVIVYGIVGGERFFQGGRITETHFSSVMNPGQDNQFVLYDAFRTDALSKGGFSGGPVYLEESGELVGITLFSEATTHNSLGGARADNILSLLEFERDHRIKELKQRVK